MPDLDHRYMVPPSLRIADRRKTSSGDEVCMWHLRVAQPNVSHLPSDVMHSLEHLLGDYLGTADEAVFAAAPMGCQTGFYIIAAISDFAKMSALLKSVLEAAGEATAVPHANVIQCGRAANHSLTGAQEVVRWLLDHEDEWADPGPNAREV